MSTIMDTYTQRYTLRVRPVWVCTEHQFFTMVDPVDGCQTHGTGNVRKRYAVAYNFGQITQRANGDYRVYDTYSGAYSYVYRSRV